MKWSRWCTRLLNTKYEHIDVRMPPPPSPDPFRLLPEAAQKCQKAQENCVLCRSEYYVCVCVFLFGFLSLVLTFSRGMNTNFMR